ncbi:uncharacterized protein LOC111383764, partial [Olea europaea var. sylvestris]|uniref:uncharacterized protein LOC111383764 n=1 Tax=Olea europaea var. sylvestris TaxID=158386 RepID=UPI000C1D0E75
MQHGHKYDPYANTYNPGLRDHPNLSYGENYFIAPQSQFNHSPGFNQQRQPLHSQPRQQTLSQSSKMSLKYMLKSLASSTIQFQQETKTSIKNLETQELVQQKNLSCEKDEDKTPTSGSKVDSKSPIPNYVPSPPFPGRFAKSKRDEHEKETLEAFRKVQVNIPLLDAIYQVPHYAKFLKKLCTNKYRLKGNEVDPRSFTIPCIIGNTRFEKAMLDLGASINVMPYSIYAYLNLGSLNKTGVIIQHADRSNVFSEDFYVLGMQDESTSLSPPFLLGRPFMRTAHTKIDVHDNTLTMEFDGEIIHFNIFETM